MGKACWQLEHWIVCPHKFWGNNTATRQCGQLYFLVWRGTINAVEQSVQKMVMPAPTSSTSKCFPQTVQTKCMEIMELPFSCLEFSNWPGNGQFESRKARGPVRPLPRAKPSEFSGGRRDRLVFNARAFLPAIRIRAGSRLKPNLFSERIWSMFPA